MSEFTDVRCLVIKGDALTRLQQDSSIRELAFESLQTDFLTRPHAELKYAVHNSEKTRVDPNSQVGKGFRRKQRFAQPISVVAFHDGDMVGHLTMADNASSRLPWPASLLDIHARLHFDHTKIRGNALIEHRYRAIGLVSMADTLRDEIRGNSPHQANAVDMMLATALLEGNPRQPVSAYPWREEKLLKNHLNTVGLQRDSSPEETVYPFGQTNWYYNDAGPWPTTMTRWVADSGDTVMHKILAKDGAEVGLEEMGIRTAVVDWLIDKAA